MGRESVAIASWNGEVAEVKALLESTEIILRGAIRTRIARTSISAYRVEDDTLVVAAGHDELRLELGQQEARRWATALAKPLPTLAVKLGISAIRPAFLIGQNEDAELQAALSGATTAKLEEAAVLIAVLNTESDLHPATDIAQGCPRIPIWCVYGKGKFTTVPDATIRAYMRAHGFVDNKTSGVSDRTTATRYMYKPG